MVEAIIVGMVVAVFALVIIGVELFNDYMDEQLKQSNEGLEIFIGSKK